MIRPAKVIKAICKCTHYVRWINFTNCLFHTWWKFQFCECVAVQKLTNLHSLLLRNYDLQRTNVYLFLNWIILVEKKFHVAVDRDLELLFLSQYAPANSTVQQNPTKRRNFQWCFEERNTLMTFMVCSLVSLSLPEFSITKFAISAFFSKDICAAILNFALASVNPVRSINRCSWRSSSLETKSHGE